METIHATLFIKNQGFFQVKKYVNKAELLQLQPHPFICMINFINKKV